MYHPQNRPYASLSKIRQTRIETIQRCPPGTFVRVENEVITLHNSPRWDPQNRYIYNSDSRVKNTDIIYKDQITSKTIERPATDKKQMGLRALKNNQWRP